MSKSCTLYLVRHGETEWNQKGLVQGHTDIALSTEGEIQAKSHVAFFNKINFDGVISSDLSRAMQTALILTNGRNSLPLQTTPLLREQSWGPWEGKLFNDMQKHFGEKYNAYTGTEVHGVPQVESHFQVAKRVEPYLNQIAVSSPSKSFLIVTHGGVLKSLIFYLGLSQYDDAHFANLGHMKVVSDGEKLTFIEAHGLYVRDYSKAK